MALSLLLAACAAPVPTPAGPGSIHIKARYGKAPAGEEVSIGGYGAFVTLTDPLGKNSKGAGLIEEEEMVLSDLLPGLYEVKVRLAWASDAVECSVVAGERECRRSFGGTTAECAAQAEVEAGLTTEIVLATAGMNACTIGGAE